MDKLNALTQQLSATWKRISFNQRVSIVLVAVVAFVGLWMFAKLSHRPSMALLYPQALDQADAARIKEKLRDEKVRYELRDNGRRIYVPAHLVNELRLTMASEGLPADSGGTGWADIFKGRGLGAQSEMMININKLRALQGELSRTISSLAGVRGARVHLVMPKPTLFKQDEEPAKASVVLNLSPGHELGPSEVNGIRYLCASAIEGLKTNNITILDGTGRILARPRESDSMLEGTGEQLALTRQVEKQFTQKIAAQLDPAFGSGGWTATVSVELDNKSLHRELTTSDEGATLEEEYVETRRDSTKEGAGGEPGAAPNIDVTAMGEGPGGRTTDSSSTTRVRYHPDMTVEQLEVLAGSIKRVAASVTIDEERTPTTEDGTTLSVADVEELVKGVIMYDETRGDQVIVREASFYKGEERDEQVVAPPNPIVTAIARHGPAAIVSIALLGFLWVVMKKTKYADHARGPARRVIAAAAAGAPGEMGAGVPTPAASDKRVQEIFKDIVLEDGEAEFRGLREAMGRLADQKPESVAAVIRDWIR